MHLEISCLLLVAATTAKSYKVDNNNFVRPLGEVLAEIWKGI